MTRHARGSVVVWAVLTVGVLLAFVAVVLNAGHLTSVKGELQNGVDASVLSGAAQLTGNTDELASATAEAGRVAGLHYTDSPGNVRMATDQLLLGEWRPGTRPGCEAGDFATAFGDTSGAHFCEVRARDAAGAFRINSVYGRAQRAANVSGGGAVPLFFSAFLGRGPSGTANQAAEAIAITGGPCGSTCLNIPMVLGVGCLTGSGGSACASNAPPDSPGPMYTLGLSPTPVRSAGWSVFNNSSPSASTLCNFMQTTLGGCLTPEIGSYIQVDTGQGNKFSSGCHGGAGVNKICDWFKAMVGTTIEVPLISYSGNLTESCPSNYTGSAWVVGYSAIKLLAVNCSANVHSPDCVGAPYCTDNTAPCSQFAANECILAQLLCNHRSGSTTTGCAWTGTSTFKPILVQSRGASN